MVFLAIEADVRSGDIACRLVRPVPYLGAQLAEALGEAAVRLAALGPTAFLFAWLFAGGLPADPRGLLLAPPLALVGSALWVTTLVLIGLSAFWIIDTTPVYWIWQKLGFVLGGLLFPLELYPEWLRRAALLTPFPNLAWASGRTAFGFAPGEAAVLFAQGLLWIGLFGLALFVLARRARARLVVDGG
jgi:ABC-2 type transport system permease protein